MDKDKIYPVLDQRFRRDLDEFQIQAVEAPLGNTKIISIAGSGKTRVLTYRVANLISHGIPEEEMILLTFTNAAAAEMNKRVCGLLNKNITKFMTGTYHHVAARFLRKYAPNIKFNKNFTIINQKEQADIIAKMRQDFLSKPANISVASDKIIKNFPPQYVLREIYTTAIDHNIRFIDFMNQTFPYNQYDSLTKEYILKIFESYIEEKRRTNTMDYSDLLLNFYDLLLIDSVRDEILENYKYIFVDEYQDVNYWQFKILELLNGHNTLFAIGDPAQCIYQFRGSGPEFLDNFGKVFKNTKSFELQYNYRSTQEILDFAQPFIRKNSDTRTMVLKSKVGNGLKPIIYEFSDEISQYNELAREIKRKVSNGDYKYSDIAILVKKRQEITDIEKVFREYDIPLVSIGGVDFFKTKHIADILALVEVIDNPTNKKAFFKVMGYLSKAGSLVFNSVYTELIAARYRFKELRVKDKTDVGEALELLTDLSNKRNLINPGDLIKEFFNKFYKEYMIKGQVSAADKIDDINFLIDTAKSFDDLRSFLDAANLQAFKKNIIDENKNEITVITIHKAKGKEWPLVVIPTLNGGKFPTTTRPNDLENERKLMHVAITRAKRELITSNTKSYKGKDQVPSLFLSEFQKDTYERG